MDTRNKILDIAMNLNRMGNWAADDYEAKRERIITFLGNTTQYIQSIDQTSFPPSFVATYDRFNKEYPRLENEGIKGPKNSLEWAESLMTWGNILTHRSKLLTVSKPGEKDFREKE